jgi:diacylglycerol kinase
MNLKKTLNSFRYAFQGIGDLFRTQPNSQVHALVSLLVIAAGFFFKIDRTEWLIIVVCIVLVISLEAMNTAIVYLTDLVSPDYHPLAGRTKDVAAGAVLIAAMGTIIVGLLIFLPKIALLWQ